MNQQLQSPFFRHLPPELRQTIYSFALTSNNEPITDSAIDNTPPNNQPPILGLSLPQTCRRIYHEIDTRPFYSHNRFNFAFPSRVSEFFHHLRQTGKLELLTDLSFDMRHALHIPPSPKPDQESRYYYSYRYAEWEHYLICTVSVEDRERTSPCALHDFLHLSDGVHSIHSLRTLVLDLVQLQRNVRESETPRGRVLGTSFHRFDGIVLSLAKLAPEARIRMLDFRMEVVELVVPKVGDGDVERDAEKDAAVREWATRLLKEGLEGVLLKEV